MVTWNPMVSEIVALPGATKVFDSAQIPGEIIDMMVANTEVLDGQSRFRQGAGRHLVRDHGGDDRRHARRRRRPRGDGRCLGHRPGRLRGPARRDQAVPDAGRSGRLHHLARPQATTMDKVRTFLFDKGLLGAGAPSADVIGIELPDGKVLGDAGNVKLRFTADLHEDGGRRSAVALIERSAPLAERVRPSLPPLPARRCPTADAAGSTIRATDAPDQPSHRCCPRRWLPFVLLVIAYARRLGRAAGRQSQRQAAAGARQPWPTPSTAWPSCPTSAPANTCSGPTPRRASARLFAGARHLDASSRWSSAWSIGMLPYVAGAARAVRRRRLDGAAAGAAADPVHRLGPGRNRPRSR